MSKRKPYVRPMEKDWFMKKSFYKRYMMREFTSIFYGIYSLILLGGLASLVKSPEAFAAWQQGLTHPVSISFHILALIATCYHAITWSSLTPKAVHLQKGTKKVEDKVIVMLGHAGWAIASILVFAVVMMGGAS